MMTGVEEVPLGKLPDHAPVVEGEMIPLSKQRLEDGGWLTVYLFRKYRPGIGVVERLRHFAMWKTEQGGCRYKVYETEVTEHEQATLGSNTQATAQSPLPYLGKIMHLENSPMDMNASDPGALLDNTGPCSQPLFDIQHA